MPKGPFWTPSRILSGLVFLVVLAAGTVFTEGTPDRAARYVMAPVVWGLLCVWFSDALGGLTGSLLSFRKINKETPPEVLYWFGWVMLLLPGVLFFIL